MCKRCADHSLLSVRPDGPALVTGGGFGPEGGVVMLAGLGVGIAVFLWWVHRQYGLVSIGGHIAVPDLWITSDGDR